MSRSSLRGGEGSQGKCGAKNTRSTNVMLSHTVDGDGHALGEDVAIGADEGRDLVEGVGLEELSGRVGDVGLDLLDVEVVGLRDGADGRGAGVALYRSKSAKARV